MEMFGREVGVRGYHIYQQLWEAAIGEELECQHERGKAADAYAISVIREGTVIGYLLKKDFVRLYAIHKKRRSNSLSSNW